MLTQSRLLGLNPTWPRFIILSLLFRFVSTNLVKNHLWGFMCGSLPSGTEGQKPSHSGTYGCATFCWTGVPRGHSEVVWSLSPVLCHFWKELVVVGRGFTHDLFFRSWDQSDTEWGPPGSNDIQASLDLVPLMPQCPGLCSLQSLTVPGPTPMGTAFLPLPKQLYGTRVQGLPGVACSMLPQDRPLVSFKLHSFLLSGWKWRYVDE